MLSLCGGQHSPLRLHALLRRGQTRHSSPVPTQPGKDLPPVSQCGAPRKIVHSVALEKGSTSQVSDGRRLESRASRHSHTTREGEAL